MKYRFRAYALPFIVLLCYSITYDADGVDAASVDVKSKEVPQVEATEVYIIGTNRAQTGKFVLSAARLQKFSTMSDQIIIELEITQTNDRGGVRKITADYGEYSRTDKVVKLSGKVVVKEKATETSKELVTALDTLTVSLEDFE